MSQERTVRGGYVNPATMRRGPNGRALCRNCDDEVPKGRLTFCGHACVEEWKLRCDAGFQRRTVKKRDRGVCAKCGLDTIAAKQAFLVACHGWHRHRGFPDLLHRPPDAEAWPRVEPLRADELARVATWARSWHRDNAPDHPVETRALLVGFDPHRLTWWDMDHELPVVEGGGVDRAMTAEQVLSNLRTLCQPCHKAATSALAGRRAAARKDQRQHNLFE